MRGGGMHRPMVETIEGGAVQVGRQVELTRDEQRSLEELSKRMERLASRRTVGWFLPWLQAHKAAHQVIRRAFQRAQQ